MPLLALATLMSLPQPTNARLPDIRAIFSADDFPAYLQRQGVSRIVYVRATVRPDGTLQSCGAEVSSGDSKLDGYTCELIEKRARFGTATWTDGTPVYGVLRVPVSWVIADRPLPDDALLKATTPDLDVSVNKLPKGAHKVVAVELEVAADEKGHVLACQEQPPFKGDPRKHFPELVQIACQQAATLQLSPPTDANSKAVRSIQSVSVHFEVGREQAPHENADLCLFAGSHSDELSCRDARGAPILSSLDSKADNALIREVEARSPGSLCSVVGSDGHALLMSFGRRAVADVDGKPIVLSYQPLRGDEASFTGAGVRVSGDLERQEVADIGKAITRDVSVKVEANGRTVSLPAKWTCQKSLMTGTVRFSH